MRTPLPTAESTRRMKTFEFIVPERPVSQQTRRRNKLVEWKSLVREYAEKEWSSTNDNPSGPTAILLIYLHERVVIDADNIVKPIQDASKGLVFEDDSIITDITVRRRALDTTFRVRSLSPILASGLDLNAEFVHVRVEDAPPQDELP